MAHPLLDSDVYIRIGGRDKLTQLINPGGTTSWDPATLAIVMQDAWNYVVAAVGVQAELIGYTNDELRTNFPELITLGAQLSIVKAWLYGSAGQAMPDRVVALQAQVEAELQRLAERRRKHGAVGFSPSPAQAIVNIDMNPNHDRMTLDGFRRGGLI